MNNLKFPFVVLFFIPSLLFAQQGFVEYQQLENGKKNGEKFKVVYDNGLAQINPDAESKIKNYIDYKNKQTIQLVKQQNNSVIGIKNSFPSGVDIVYENTNEKIIGYPVKKATYSVNSNKIEVFYNEDLAIKASPSFRQLPQLGTILKVITNGNYVIEAIRYSQKPFGAATVQLPESVTFVNNEAVFNKAAIESRYSTIPVFNNDTIYYSEHFPRAYPSLHDTLYHFGNGNILLKKIQLPEFKNGDALFMTVTQRSNGDAYDRTGVVLALPVAEGDRLMKAFQNVDITALPSFKAANGKDYRGVVTMEDYHVPYELMRFFTPFGIGAYNSRMKIEGYTWPDSASYTQDISDMKAALSNKEVYIMMSITNYDKGGHIASLDFKVFPGSDSKNAIGGNSNFHKMLFNTTNMAEAMGQGIADMFDGDSLRLQFTLQKPLKQAFLRYLSTGWGGWGNGDEFLPKINEIFLNDNKVFSFVPWRSDCVTYRNLNPVSGNFNNGLSSSDLSRSNWCPGTTTNPIYIPLGNLAAGTYTLKVAIPMSKPEGNNYSGWNVSGLLEGIE